MARPDHDQIGSSLQHLDLSDNKLAWVHELPLWPNLFTLKLDGNPLQLGDEAYFPTGLNRLRYISMANTRLNSFRMFARLLESKLHLCQIEYGELAFGGHIVRTTVESLDAEHYLLKLQGRIVLTEPAEVLLFIITDTLIEQLERGLVTQGELVGTRPYKIQVGKDLRENVYLCITVRIGSQAQVKLLNLKTSQEVAFAAEQSRLQHQLNLKYGVPKTVPVLTPVTVCYQFQNMVAGKHLVVVPQPVRQALYFESIISHKQLIWHLQSLLKKAEITISLEDCNSLLKAGISQLTPLDFHYWGEEDLPYAQIKVIVQGRAFAYNIDLMQLPSSGQQRQPLLQNPGKLIFVKTHLELAGSLEAVQFTSPCAAARMYQDRQKLMVSVFDSHSTLPCNYVFYQNGLEIYSGPEPSFDKGKLKNISGVFHALVQFRESGVQLETNRVAAGVTAPVAPETVPMSVLAGSTLQNMQPVQKGKTKAPEHLVEVKPHDKKALSRSALELSQNQAMLQSPISVLGGSQVGHAPNPRYSQLQQQVPALQAQYQQPASPTAPPEQPKLSKKELKQLEAFQKLKQSNPTQDDLAKRLQMGSVNTVNAQNSGTPTQVYNQGTGVVQPNSPAFKPQTQLSPSQFSAFQKASAFKPQKQ